MNRFNVRKLTEPEPVDPGMVLIMAMNSRKLRPWLVLWVDDVEDIACMVASTSQADYPGTIPSEHPAIEAWASWVQLQPLRLLRRTYRYHPPLVIDKDQRDRLSAALHDKLWLTKED